MWKTIKNILAKKACSMIGNLQKKLKYPVFITNLFTFVKNAERLNKLMLNKMKVEDLILKQTCDCCPEQYDVIYNKDRIGYIRYRSGIFTCQPVIKNEIQHYYLVYESFKNWHLTLHDDNREELLLKSKEKLVEFWNNFKNINK